MASSFFALFDDIAVLAKAAASSLDDVAAGASKAAVKTAGVVIDDTAVTPQYVQGIGPKRELPVVGRIARGSLINKAVIIVAIMLLSIWAPWVFPWLLIAGGTYLAYEGAEKVWHWVRHRRETTAEEVVERDAVDEKQIVASAVRTDLVLSTEIMLISLASIDADTWQLELGTLIAVGLIMTALVYGTVALLIKMDDIGLWLATRPLRVEKALGTALVKAMPVVFRTLTIVGVIAMLWVGGHILITNLAEVGWMGPERVLHSITHAIQLPGALAWLFDSLLSAAFGLCWGAAVVLVVTGLHSIRPRRAAV